MEQLFVHHFVAADADGIPRIAYTGEAVAPGLTMHLDGEIMPCDRGFHGSVKALDALKYAPGAWYAPRLLSGTIVEDDDKHAASDMRVLTVVDASMLLHEFACAVAEKALKTANVTDERSWNVMHVKSAWLRGEATDDELAAAWDAAWAAASDAASDAARAAAGAAAWGAAGDAAWAAARAAAGAAAWGAAARAAARDAARNAAWNAAWAVMNADLEQRLAALSGVYAGVFEESERE